MSIQPLHVTMSPSKQMEVNLRHGGTMTIPVLSQEVLNSVAKAYVQNRVTEKQIFTLRFQNGNLHNFDISVDERSCVSWNKIGLFHHPLDWLSVKIPDAKNVIRQYLDTAVDKIREDAKSEVEKP